MIVDVKDLEAWRKQNPDEKSVLVKHCDAVARWDFGVINPDDTENNWRLRSLGAYTGDGKFVFYDQDGNRHTRYNEMQSKMMLNTHELWKQEN